MPGPKSANTGFDENVANDVLKDNFGDDPALQDDVGSDPGSDPGSDDGEAGLENFGDDPGSDDGVDDRGEDDDLGQDEQPPQRQQQQRQPEPRQQQQRPKSDADKRREAFERRAKVRADRQGNLVNEKGEIVARAGREARYYNSLTKAQRDMVNMDNQARAVQGDLTSRLKKAVDIGVALHDELKVVKENAGYGDKLGLPQSAQRQALEFAKQLLDPATRQTALTSILTLAAANGTDLTKLGLNGSGIDVAGLKAMMGDMIKPLTEAQTAAQQREQQMKATETEQQEALQTVQRFFAENPAALPYQQVFTRVYGDPRYANLSMSEVWARIQLALMRQGRAPGQRGNGGQNRQQRRQNLPNGRRAPGGGGDFDPARNNQPADPSKSYDAILRDVLKDTGYRTGQ